MEKIKQLYAKLPKEITVFIEYILPSAIITALIQYLVGLEINNVYLAGAINIILIFLREIKPRYERAKK